MKNQASTADSGQSGSVIIWIFIMIAIFAALSFALTKGMRSGDSTMDSQTARLQASEIITFLNQVKNTVRSLEVSGCAVTAINFTNVVYVTAGNAAVETAPAGATANCAVYGLQGGNITPVVFSESLSSSYSPTGTTPKSGHFAARYANPTLGTSENDLIYYATGFKNEICLSVLNQILSINTMTTLPAFTLSTAGSNSYTQGTAGSLTAFTMPGDSPIYVGAPNANYCTIAVVLKVR